MPIIIKAQSDEHTGDVIKKFKKATVASGIVDRSKDRKYHKKPAQIRAIKKTERRRLKKRARSLKKMKNIPAAVMQKIYDKLSSK